MSTKNKFPQRLYRYEVNSDFCNVDLIGEPSILRIEGNCDLPAMEVKAIQNLFPGEQKLRIVFNFPQLASMFPYYLARALKEKIGRAAFVVHPSIKTDPEEFLWSVVRDPNVYRAAVDAVSHVLPAMENSNAMIEGDPPIQYTPPQVTENDDESPI